MRLKAVGGFIAIRLLSLATLALITDSKGVNFERIFYRWDAQWYRRIAQDGYGYVATAADGRQLADYAFFPLYPLLERAVHHLSSLSYIYSGLLISAISSLIAALGIYSVVEKIASTRIAFLVVILWAALPVGLVQTLAYSESLFTAFAAWALYFTLRRQYLAAGLLASLAGATRPVGIAVGIAVAVTIFLYHRRRRFDAQSIAGIVIAPIGWLGYIYWVGEQVGQWNGYFLVADGWGNTFDGGREFIEWIGNFFREGDYLIGTALTLAILVLAALVVKLHRIKVPLVVMLYTVALALFALVTSGYFGSKPRYILPAFPLLIPIAQWISHQGRRNSRFISLFIVLASSIYGGIWLTSNGPL